MKLEDTKEYKDYAARIEKKRKSIKQGDDVIHINYFSGIIDDSDLNEYENKLQSIDLKLSSYDQSGDIHNSLEEFSLITYFVLSNSTILEILNGTITNLTWETIKYLSLHIWKKIKNKSITESSPDSNRQKSVTFGMKVRLDENTEFDFELNGEYTEQTILKSLDKTLKFIASQKLNQQYKHPYYVKYDQVSKSWKSTDVEEEIRTRLKNGEL